LARLFYFDKSSEILFGTLNKKIGTVAISYTDIIIKKMTFAFLAMACPANSHYMSQMSLNIATCQHPDGDTNMPGGVGEGCKCDQGFIAQADVCIPETECGCIYDTMHGTIYLPVCIVSEHILH